MIPTKPASASNVVRVETSKLICLLLETVFSWTKKFEKAKAEAWKIYRRRGEFLIKLLQDELGLRGTSPEGAFYTMVDVRGISDDLEIAERFLQNCVITVPGIAFGNKAKGFLHVSFCNNEGKIVKGVRRMKEVLI
ncbi:hypothetical protein BH20ACI1_BH20ACI1_16040 [soil metagenome]